MKTKRTNIFSISNFKELFYKSDVKDHLTAFQIEQIQTAMREGDFEMLKRIYKMLLKEEEADNKIMGDLAKNNEEIMDKYVVSVMEVKNKYLEKPKKQKMIAREAEDQNEVEDILKNL